MTDKIIIPEAALQQHIAVLGKTGSGKTYAAKGAIVEPLLERGRRVGIIDPTGAWWGLRSSRDGKGPGFPVLVLGGDHGDLPLPALGGAAVARLLVEQGVNLVADTSHLTVGESARWFIDFAGTIYRLNKTPLHLVIDEAHNFAPQGKVPDPDTGRMLHAANRLASGGRSRGIRLIMVTQRPQKLHKDTLTSADTLIAMRVLAPHDRQAVKDWIDGCGDAPQGRVVLGSLAGLQRGEGWVWYPEGGHLVQAKFPRIVTFDSSATPTDGHLIAAPKGSAEIDLTEIKSALADAVREAEANDPKLLRAEVARLRAELARSTSENHSTEALRAEYMRGHDDGASAGLLQLKTVADRLSGINSELSKCTTELGSVGVHLYGAVDAAKAHRVNLPASSFPTSEAAAARIGSAHIARRQPAARNPAAKGQPMVIGKAERLILTALAQYPEGRTKIQVAVLTGYAVGGGGFNNAIGALRSAGRINGSADRLVITPQGISDLGPFDPLPQGQDLLRYWLGQLGKAERKALEELAAAYPRTLSKPQLAARAGYEPGGGGFNNALSRLRTLELISGRGEMRASEEFFR